MKKFTSLILILTLVIMAFAGCAGKPKESPASDFEYELSQDGTAVYINKYIGTSENVVIPGSINGLPVVSLKGVVKSDGIIETGVFENSKIKSVTLSADIESIGLNAFKNCKELSKIAFNANLNIICDRAFANCINLKEIDLSGTKVETIRDEAFAGCGGIKIVLWSENLSSIGKKAFFGCESLVSVALPKSLEKVGGDAFTDCLSLEKVSVPANLDLSLPNSSAFSHVPALKSIVFEGGRESLTGYSFFYLETGAEIIIPDSVKYFSFYTFFGPGSSTLVFNGDCPIIEGDIDHYGTLTVKYDPSKKGWDDCAWKESKDLFTGAKLVFQE